MLMLSMGDHRLRELGRSVGLGEIYYVSRYFQTKRFACRPTSPDAPSRARAHIPGLSTTPARR